MGFKDSDRKDTIGGKIRFEILCQCLELKYFQSLSEFLYFCYVFAKLKMLLFSQYSVSRNVTIIIRIGQRYDF